MFYVRRQITTLLLGLCLLSNQALALTASEAASRAQSEHGGKVLAVKETGDNTFQVRLLLPGGKVITVTIRG